MTELRLFSGVIQMVRLLGGTTNIQNEHWVSWATSQEAALGHWVATTTAKHPDRTMAYHAIYDITDVALQQLARP